MYWGRILDIVSWLKTKKTKFRLFLACWMADCVASYVSSEILSKFTRVSLLISLISFELPPDCFALSICAYTKVQMIWNVFSSQSAGTKIFDPVTR